MGQKKSKQENSKSNASTPTTPVSPKAIQTFEKPAPAPTPTPVVSKDSSHKELEEMYDKYKKVDGREDTPENDYISVKSLL